MVHEHANGSSSSKPSSSDDTRVDAVAEDADEDGVLRLVLLDERDLDALLGRFVGLRRNVGMREARGEGEGES